MAKNSKKKKLVDSSRKRKAELVKKLDRTIGKILKDADSRKYTLRLYVAGTTVQSTRAILNIKRICEEFLRGRYELEVIDIYQKPLLASSEQILAAPTLIKLLPHPLRRIIGDLSNQERVLIGLDLTSDARLRPMADVTKPE